MDLRLFSLFLVCLSLRGLVNGHEIRDITAAGFWWQIFDDVNRDTVPKEYTAQYRHGLKTDQSDERTATIKYLKPSLNGWAVGDLLQILSIDLGTEGERLQASGFKNQKETEIHRQSEKTLKFTIQPGQRVVKWQRIIDIGGIEYADDVFLTTENDVLPAFFGVNVKVLCRRQIKSGASAIRIKHSATNRYLNIVERDRWPAATTGLSRNYIFVLWDYGTEGVVIRTHNSMFAGFEYLTVWPDSWNYNDGWIYATTFANFNAKKGIYWSVSKPFPLYDGDAVTFKSQLYPDSYLCRRATDNAVTDVFPCKDQPDEWILETD